MWQHEEECLLGVEHIMQGRSLLRSQSSHKDLAAERSSIALISDSFKFELNPCRLN
jgi:hypothetical protein